MNLSQRRHQHPTSTPFLHRTIDRLEKGRKKLSFHHDRIVFPLSPLHTLRLFRAGLEFDGRGDSQLTDISLPKIRYRCDLDEHVLVLHP